MAPATETVASQPGYRVGRNTRRPEAAVTPSCVPRHPCDGEGSPFVTDPRCQEGDLDAHSTRRFVAPLLVALALAVSGLPAAPSAVQAAGPVTALVIDSEPGDSIGSGQQLEYVPPASTSASTTFKPGWTFVQVLGADGRRLLEPVVQRRPARRRWPWVRTRTLSGLADATHPGLDIGGQGRGCNTSTGRFVISELERDAAGTVTTLAASFEQHCEGAPAALFGELRYQASTGYKLMTVAPASIDLDRPASVRRRLPRPSI